MPAPAANDPPTPWLEGLGETVLPALEGRSILNLHRSILDALGAPVEGDCDGVAPSLAPDIAGDHLGEARRIVLLVLDALGQRTLERLLQTGRLPAWERLAAHGHHATLTSLFPSATNVVLTSLHSGLPPLRHGVPGYRVYLPALGDVAEMIRFRVLDRQSGRRPDLIFDRGVELDSFAHPTLFERLARRGVSSRVVFRRAIIDSHLSLLNHRGAEGFLGFITPADQCILLRRALESLGERGGFVYTYWDAIDTQQHVYGAGGEEVEAELALVLHALEREFIGRLPRRLARETILIVASDHGQVTVAPERCFAFHDHPEILDLLETRPAGNSRVTYLRAVPGRSRELEARLRERMPPWLRAVAVREVIDSGLLGRGPAHPEIRERIGDFVVFAGPDAGTHYHPEGQPPQLVGHHGGLSAEEMLVPLLVVDLGSL